MFERIVILNIGSRSIRFYTTHTYDMIVSSRGKPQGAAAAVPAATSARGTCHDGRRHVVSCVTVSVSSQRDRVHTSWPQYVTVRTRDTHEIATCTAPRAITLTHAHETRDKHCIVRLYTHKPYARQQYVKHPPLPLTCRDNNSSSVAPACASSFKLVRTRLGRHFDAKPERRAESATAAPPAGARMRCTPADAASPRRPYQACQQRVTGS